MNPFAPWAALRGTARVAAEGLARPRRRVVRTRPGQVFISVRGVHDPARADLARAVEKSLQALEGVRWAQVNPVLAQVLVSFEDGAVGVDDLAAVIAAAEESHGSPDDDFAGGAPPHPADTQPMSRAATALAGDVLGLFLGAFGRLVRAPALPIEAASAVTALDSLAPVRRVLDRRPQVATAAAVFSAALQGLGQGPLGLLADGAHRVSLLTELSARRQAWLDAESHLCDGAAGDPPPHAGAPSRPVPLPPTLAERYVEASSNVALGGAALALLATRSPQRGADILLSGAPRAARLGVESFAAQVDRTLAARDVIAMDPAVLRRLDIVDTVVVDASLLANGLGASDEVMERGAAAVVDAARDAAHDVVIAGDDLAAKRFGADLCVPGGARLAASVRELQSGGRVVALVSGSDGAALRSADCGIGVARPGEAHPPWGAHLMCLHLSDAAAVIEATALARGAGKQAASLAAAGAVAAGILALGPMPGAGRRAVAAVQLATLAAMAAGTHAGTRMPPRQPVAAERRAPPWHALPAASAFEQLGSGERGLSDDEARRRADPDGGPASPGLPRVLLDELANPLTAVLGAGAALSAAAGSLVDSLLISGVIGADATIGALERLKTESAIRELGEALTGEWATVVREGRETRVPGEALVAGDLLHLSAGDAVPADARLVRSHSLEVDESSLTGESLPVVKRTEPVQDDAPVADRESMVYAGTSVAAGRAEAVVVATGRETEARRGSVDGPARTTGVDARLRSLTDRTVPVVLGAGAALTANGLLRGQQLQEAVTAGVSLAAAAVPEGLPFVATVAQAAAAHRLARREILVRNPQVLEALGRVQVLCFDKTGTLTCGQLSLARISDGAHESSLSDLDDSGVAVVAAALRATPRPRKGGLPHPTDQAVVDGAARVGVSISAGTEGWKKASSLPFEPGRGYHAVEGRVRSGLLLSVKGAPEVVLPRCSSWRRRAGSSQRLDAAARKALGEEVDRLARQGLRVLAVAEREHHDESPLIDERVDGLELVGLVGVSDEARSTAAGPIRHLQEAGITVMMITGDHPSTAEAIASDLGLLNGHRVMTGPELDALDDEQLDTAIEGIAVFARVTPAHKVRLVSALQRSGRVVAMTGDGANDSQAIRLADVGIAFGPRSTPAAQASADIVITRDDLAALIETMVEGRAMWVSVRDALAVLLGGNLGEVLFTTGGALVSGSAPLTSRQLLTVNLFTDLGPAIAIAMQQPRSRVELAREGPETSLTGPLARDVAVRAAATSAGAYGAWIAARMTGSTARARTVALAALVGTQLGQTVVVGRHSPLVLATAAVSMAGLFGVVETPGVNNFFGCRPLGPVGWGLAMTAAGIATAGAVVAGGIVR